jgi:hypothetical protein
MRSKRQDNLHELAEAQAENSSNDATSHLKQIKHRELMKNDYAAVRKVINTVTKKRGGGGITLLRVKKDNTHDTLLEPLEISRALRDHAIKHYGQANATPFGKRDVFDKLTEDPMKNPFYDEIMSRMLEHQHELSASQKLFGKHLRSKVSADLAPEADKLAEPMTLIEWRKCFLKSERGNNNECGKRTPPGPL